MRVLHEDSQKLVYGGLSGWVIVGVGLVFAGLAFGAFPLFLFLRDREIPFLFISMGGLALLFTGFWGLGHKHRVELDAASRVIRVMRGNRFLSSPQAIPFDRVNMVGIKQTLYTSVSAGVARREFVLELRLGDGGCIKIDDQDVLADLERTRQQGRHIAELLATPFDGEPTTST
jgi:hypothetical protein